MTLDRTVIGASVDGWVTTRTVQVSQVVQPNQPVLFLTLAYDLWVEAHINQSLGTATGAMTQLLLPNNATGNFVRVVQLAPVRIVFNPAHPSVGGHLRRRRHRHPGHGR